MRQIGKTPKLKPKKCAGCGKETIILGGRTLCWECVDTFLNAVTRSQAKKLRKRAGKKGLKGKARFWRHIEEYKKRENQKQGLRSMGERYEKDS